MKANDLEYFKLENINMINHKESIGGSLNFENIAHLELQNIKLENSFALLYAAAMYAKNIDVFSMKNILC